MARKRMIDPGIWTSEQVNNLSHDARLLFIGLISNADDKGRLKGSPRYLKAIIFPYDSIDADCVKDWLNEIIQQQLAILYNVNGDDYITLPKFLKHQTINRPSESRLPKPAFTEASMSNHGGLNEHSSLIEDKLIEDKLIEDKRDSLNNHGGLKERAKIELPEWINEETWNDYIEMRKMQKKAPTDGAIKLIIAKLERLKNAGDDPNEVLKQSIISGWTGVFPIKEDKSAKAKGHPRELPKTYTPAPVYDE